MKKIPLLFLMAVLAVPLFAQQLELRDSDFYTQTTRMSGNGYTLDFKEIGDFEKTPSQGDGYVLDPDPYGYRDFIPPSCPEGLRGVALDAHATRLTWQASMDNVRVTGYRVFRNGTAIGFSPEESFTDTGLNPMTFYRYTIQAMDKDMNLSEMSGAIYITTLDSTTQAHAPRFVSSPSIRYVSDSVAVVGFTTDKAVTAVVEYGATSAYGQSVAGSDFYTDQLVTITGLTPGALYHYRVSVTDYSGHGPVVSRDDTFYTSWTTDTAAPKFVQPPIVAYTSDTMAVITFRTDEDALGTVRYGTHSLSENIADEPYFTTDHSMILSGLEPHTWYLLEVSTIDRAGNGPAKAMPRWFRTRTEPDTRAPIITTIPKEAYLSDTTAIITWDTDEVSDSVVRFGEWKGSYDRQASSSTMTRHHMVILTGLDAHTMYQYMVSSTDPSGNRVEGTHEHHFITDRTPDRKAPKIWKVEIKAQATCAVIIWETDELAESKILYGIRSGQLSSQEYDWMLQEHHAIMLTDLTPGTEYHFQLFAKDPAGNQSQSFELKFRTDRENPIGCDPFDRGGFDKENRDIDQGRKEPSDD